MEANGRIQITYLLTAVQLDANKFANFRPHTVPMRLKEKIPASWTQEWGSPNSKSW